MKTFFIVRFLCDRVAIIMALLFIFEWCGNSQVINNGFALIFEGQHER